MPVKSEIERRFLVKSLPPNFFIYPQSIIHQFYLDDGSNRRFRQEVGFGQTKYWQTVKSGSGVKRLEDELEISQVEFLLAQGQLAADLWKVRYHIPCNGLIAELNLFAGPLSGYMQIEVEFETMEQAMSFEQPDWFGHEVTDDPRHGNYNLARYGAPKGAGE